MLKVRDLELQDRLLAVFLTSYHVSLFAACDSELWGRAPHAYPEYRLTGATVVSKHIKAARERNREALQRNSRGIPLLHCARAVCHLICTFNSVLTPVRLVNKIVSNVFTLLTLYQIAVAVHDSLEYLILIGRLQPNELKTFA